MLKQDIVKRRKERTHRLITRGAILESLIENAEELTDEEIKILLEEVTNTKEFKKTLKIIRENYEKQIIKSPLDFRRAQLYTLKGACVTLEPNPCRDQQPFAF